MSDGVKVTSGDFQDRCMERTESDRFFDHVVFDSYRNSPEFPTAFRMVNSGELNFTQDVDGTVWYQLHATPMVIA
jgi:hypothetical protein